MRRVPLWVNRVIVAGLKAASARNRTCRCPDQATLNNVARNGLAAGRPRVLARERN